MNLRRLNADIHRDLGYFLSGLIIIYCLSGIALNHIADWNPDFVVHKQDIHLDRSYTQSEITPTLLATFGAQVGEGSPKFHDAPTPSLLKLYYDNATLLIDLSARTGHYESLRRRPFIYHFNVLHRNSLKSWRFVSDLFGLLLVIVTLTGCFLARGPRGLNGRGKWFLLAGLVPPIAGLLVFSLLQH